MERSILIGSLSGPNFAIRSARVVHCVVKNVQKKGVTYEVSWIFTGCQSIMFW